ncbi:MAG TPA: hypothetical protein VFF67_01100 [Thermoplasmata archaeon]|nr:hypothetical protein [Thermoplasmata archaeon]
MLLTAILAWLHVVSAMAWLGGGVMFGFVLTPGLRKLPPAVSGPFLIGIGPRVARFFQVVAGTTVLFGLLLLWNLGGAALLNPATTYGLELTLGTATALVAFVIAEALAVPKTLKVISILRNAANSPGQPAPAELAVAMRTAGMFATLTVLLVILTSVFMVAAGFY